MTNQQAIALAALEREHGRVVSIFTDSSLSRCVLHGEPVGSRAYFCAECGEFAVISKAGEVTIWVFPELIPPDQYTSLVDEDDEGYEAA